MGMRLAVAILLCLLAVGDIGALGSGLKSRELTVADIPPCGVR